MEEMTYKERAQKLWNDNRKKIILASAAVGGVLTLVTVVTRNMEPSDSETVAHERQDEVLILSHDDAQGKDIQILVDNQTPSEFLLLINDPVNPN